MEILILEDDILDQLTLKSILVSLGFSSIQCTSTLEEALALIGQQKADLLIADVFLNDTLTTEFFSSPSAPQLPVIFVTVSREIDLYTSLKDNHRFGFLTKPVQPVSLLATINLLMAASQKTPSPVKVKPLIVSIGKKRIKLCPQDILWLEAERNYTTICLEANRRYTIKKSLRQTILQLDDRFIQCHKRYYVNQQKIEGIAGDDVLIAEHKIPIGATYKTEFMENFNGSAQ